MQLVIGGLLVLISLWFNLSYSSPGFYLPHNDAQIKGSAASSSNGDGESFTRPDADMPTYGIWQETGPNFSTPLHEWSEQCQLPPPNQIWRSRSMQADHGHGQRKKIAFLLMEYDGVTFPDVWGEYFGRANPSHYALYIHIQKKKIPRTMSYHDLQSAHPGLYTLDESMQKVADNVQILKTTEDSYWLHLMPIFLNFWREAIVDQDVAGFIPISGACLPMKPLSALRQSLIIDRVSEHTNHSILNFANPERTKASAWGYLTRLAVSKMLRFDGEGGDLGDREFCPPCSEEICPPKMISKLNLPHHHGVITFDCWSLQKIQMNMTDNPSNIKVVKSTPCQFTSVDSTLLRNLVVSGAFFARKFEPSAMIEDLGISVRTFIVNVIRNGEDASESDNDHTIQSVL